MKKILEMGELLKLAEFLFESNEDLPLALIGGLAAQGIMANREVRKTSDIDIVAEKRHTAETLIERLSRTGEYKTYHNQELDKYSVYNWEEGIHIDIYPGKIGAYPIDENFWRRAQNLEGSSIRYASPEDLIAIKLYAYLTSSRGRIKHLVDIFSVLIGKYELDVSYFLDRLVYLGMILGCEPKFFLGVLRESNENVLTQFTSKERRILKEEIEYICRELEKYGVSA